jgi:hypothetical protein
MAGLNKFGNKGTIAIGVICNCSFYQVNSRIAHNFCHSFVLIKSGNKFLFGSMQLCGDSLDLYIQQIINSHLPLWCYNHFSCEIHLAKPIQLLHFF